MRQALLILGLDAARDRRLAGDRPGLVRRHDRALRPRRPPLPARPRHVPSRNRASPCWPPPGVLHGGCRCCSPRSPAARSTPSTTCSTSARPTPAGWGRPTSSRCSADRRVRLPDAGVRQPRAPRATAPGPSARHSGCPREGLRRRRHGRDRPPPAAAAARGGSRRDRDDAPRGPRGGAARGGRGAGRVRRVRRRGAAARPCSARSPRWSCTSSPTCRRRSTRASWKSRPRATTASARRARATSSRRRSPRARGASSRRASRSRTRPTGAGLKHEDDPLWDDAPWPWKRSVEALHELEDAVTKTEGIEGLVLRYGFFYGPGSAYAKGGYFEREVRRRRFPIVGQRRRRVLVHPRRRRRRRHGGGRRARRARHLQRRRRRAGPVREWLPVYAEAIGAKPPWRVPRFAGAHPGRRSMASCGDRPARRLEREAKAELGWQPRHASWRQGFREALG